MGSRRIYETKASKDMERAFARKVAEAFGKTLHEMPALSPVDYALMEGHRFSMWMECKCRSNKMYDYPTYMISLDKMEELYRFGRSGVPSILCVEWSDHWGWTPVVKPRNIALGGRFDRGDGMDAEMCAFIPMAEFCQMGTGHSGENNS